jgi:hypothetical protein
MKIGKFVQSKVNDILRYCKDHPGELSRLMDKDYSKKSFKLNWPFCIEERSISDIDRARYWTSLPFSFDSKSLLICSQWYPRNRSPFCNYLVSKGIIHQGELCAFLADDEDESPSEPPAWTNKPIKNRYKATTEGDAANSVIRVILSNLGAESFSREDWEATKRYFLNRCAYYDHANPQCDEQVPTHKDHIIPINKTELGEHRLGNLVPSCNACNKKKHNGDFRSIFNGSVDAIERIEAYMATRGYTPLGDKPLIRLILDQAHSEVKALVYRYISIIEAALAAGDSPDQA